VQAFVLTHLGPAGKEQSALAELTAMLPNVHFNVKTPTLVAAELDEEQRELIEATAEWSVRPATYAETAPPGLNLARMRRELDKS
jgi:hypothetical protein